MRAPALALCVAVFFPGCSSGNFSGSSANPAKPAASAPAAVPPAADASGTVAGAPVAGAPVTSAVATPPAVAATPVMTPPTNAIVKGSFTIWAVPNHPAPGEAYMLYCQLTLPAGTTGYNPADLTGQITGTDGYFQAVGAMGKASHQQFQTNGSSALLGVEVPGSYSNVVDSMTVSSALLNETQTTSLVFGY